MELTFLQAKVGRLSKTVRPTGIDPYPLAAQFKSHTATVDDLTSFAAALRGHANQGHCLHVGSLITELATWGKRAGIANRTSGLQWLVFDIDGYYIEHTLERPVSEQTFAELATRVVEELAIPELRDVSFIAQASTKLGLVPNHVSMHLFYMLSEPLPSVTIKQWLRAVNITTDALCAQLKLTANGHALTYPLDISCADPGRLIYIAPPMFVQTNDPFGNADDRIIVVQRTHDYLPSAYLRNAPDTTRQEKQIKSVLREAAGYNPRENARIKRITLNGESVELLLNPAPGTMTLAHTSRGFCYYNINNGDSAAYYHPQYRPDIIYNFKGEPAFRWADIDPKGYEEYCKTFAEDIAKADPINTFIVINQNDDKLYKIWHDHENARVAAIPTERNQIEDFYAENGKLAPAFIPTWCIEYNPPADYQVDYNGKSINTFAESLLLRSMRTTPATAYNLQTLDNIAVCVPAIWLTIDHVSGNDRAAIGRFINWLAYIVQYKRKTGTAWVFQGVEGTGKGTLYDEILSPILGKDNTTMRQTLSLNDQFDAWRKNKLLVCFDEFQVPNDRQGQSIISRLRNWITEDRASVRAMRREGFDTPLFENYIFFSNMHNMLPLPETDRRYNICPRQDTKLKDIVDTYELYAKIRDEISAFAALLSAWEVDINLAQTCLDNEAKRMTREASRTMPEEFANALINRNLDYFISMIETLNNNVTPDQILNMDRARRTISELVRSRAEPTFVACADLANLYNTLFAQNMGVIAFSKMLARLGVHHERYTDPTNRTRNQGARVHMTETTLSDSDLNELVPRLRTLQAIA